MVKLICRSFSSVPYGPTVMLHKVFKVTKQLLISVKTACTLPCDKDRARETAALQEMFHYINIMKHFIHETLYTNNKCIQMVCERCNKS